MEVDDSLTFVYTNANTRQILSVDHRGDEAFVIDTDSDSGKPSGVVCDQFGDIYVASTDVYSQGRKSQPEADHDREAYATQLAKENRQPIQRYTKTGAWLGAVHGIEQSGGVLTLAPNGDLLVANSGTVYVYEEGV